MHIQRKNIRYYGQNYTDPGYYFITICTEGRMPLFGKIHRGKVLLNPYGQAVSETWKRTASIRQNVTIHDFIIMPDHMHGIIEIEGSLDYRARQGLAPTFSKRPSCSSGSIGSIIGSFKSESTKQINQMRGVTGRRIWQRNYWDRVIRDDEEFLFYQMYIRDNPKNN